MKEGSSVVSKHSKLRLTFVVLVIGYGLVIVVAIGPHFLQLLGQFSIIQSNSLELV